MSFLSRLFGSPSGGPPDLEKELARLEEEAENARPGYVGSAFNRAGDLALRHDRSDRAFEYYGRAIDAFLGDAQREAARGVANKIIRVRPAAVRTLCTLTWLDLASRHPAMALLHLRDYVAAARDADERPRAATQVYAMARASDSDEFLEAAADALDRLDYGGRAKEVRVWLRDGAPDAIEEEDALASACLEAAIRSNDPDAKLLVDLAPDSDSSADASDESEDVDVGEPEDGEPDLRD